MKEKFNPEESNQDEKKRLGYIEGRPDLFETKVFNIVPERQNEELEGKTVLVAMRDPGSGNALLSVLKKINKESGVVINVITDGRAKEILNNNFQTKDVTPSDNILTAETIIGKPTVIIIDKSEEMGIEMYVSANFPEVPKVLIEDYYGTSIHFLSELEDRNIPLPDKICVMDEEAKELIIKRFPNLENRIEITGQPSFDRFAQENTKEISKNIKKKLGLKLTDKLVVFMSSLDKIEMVEEMAQKLEKLKDDFTFVFRRHPRDNISYETYEKMFTDRGIKVIDTNEFATNEIGAAADVILNSISTEGLFGVYRKKPTVHIIDHNVEIPKGMSLPLPPVKLGASVGIDKMDQLIEILPQLLNSRSPLNKELKKNMKKYYPCDGKNTDRIVDIIDRYIN